MTEVPLEQLEDASKKCIEDAEKALGDAANEEDLDAIKQRAEVWKRDLQKHLSDDSPYRIEALALENAESGRFKGPLIDAIRQELDDIEFFGNRIDKDEWTARCANADEDELEIIKKDLDSFWRQNLEEKTRSWMQSEIEEESKKLEKEIREHIDAVMRLNSIVINFGKGYLSDCSFNSLFEYNTNQLRKWASTFENDENIQKICELLGRMTARTVFKEVIDYQKSSHRVNIKDPDSKEELSGIELGNRIEDLLPSELGLLMDEDCEILFDLKYVENRLLCFSKDGYTQTDEERLMEIRRIEAENSAGPIIFCIDTSGSMMGEPERVAKAITLYIAMQAMSEGRDCYVISFSSNITAIDITPPKGIGDLLSFLGTSFYGGTDPLPALDHAIKMTGQVRYKKADIIMISDFIMAPNAFEPLREDIRRSKRRQCKYHSLVISDWTTADDSGVFDYSWKYSPTTGKVTDLIGIGRSIARRNRWMHA